MKFITTLLCALSMAALQSAYAKGPDDLAKRIDQALKKGDVDALVATVRIDQTPAMLMYMLMSLPNECSGDVVCTVSIKPLMKNGIKKRRVG